MAKAINTTAMNRLASIAKATNDDFERIMQETGCSLEEVQEAWKQVKANRKAERVAKAEARFSLEFKGTKFTQGVVYLTDVNRVIFKNLDKNSIIYADCKDGALVFKAITVYTEKSKKYEFGKELSKSKKAINLLNEATAGMGFDDFINFIMSRSNLTRREAKGAEKGINPAIETEETAAEDKKAVNQ